MTLITISDASFGSGSENKVAEAQWYDPILAFGADIQKAITGGKTFAENTDLSKGYLPWTYTGSGSAAVAIAETGGNIQKTTADISQGFADAGKTLTDFSSNLQDFSYNLQKGASDFFKTGGQYIGALTGQSGILGQIGAIAPLLIIGLILLVVLRR